MFKLKKTAVPEWASVLGEKEYSLFMTAVENYLKDKSEPYTIDDGMILMTDNGWQYGLSNLAQMCAQTRPEEYPALIAHHFGTFIELKAFEESLDMDDFEKMRQYIGVRLYDREYVAYGGPTMVRRPFAGEVFSVLIYDFPLSIKNITLSDMEKWGISEDELFAIGIENIRRNYQMDAQRVSVNGGDVFAVETEHFFASNILFDIEQHKELVGKGGAIICMPTRSMAVIYPIDDVKVAAVLSTLFGIAQEFYAKGPGSLTKEVFWYRDGQYEPLNYEMGKKIKFTPSEAFMSLLNSLS